MFIFSFDVAGTKKFVFVYSCPWLMDSTTRREIWLGCFCYRKHRLRLRFGICSDPASFERVISINPDPVLTYINGTRNLTRPLQSHSPHTHIRRRKSTSFPPRQVGTLGLLAFEEKGWLLRSTGAWTIRGFLSFHGTQ
jgi:hypothetical protein